jgi:cell division protein FtsW
LEHTVNQKRPFTLFNVRTGGVDMTFLILVLLLLTIGLIMLFSASYAYAEFNFQLEDGQGDSFRFIRSQLRWALIGVVAMILISTVNYNILYKLSWPFYFLTIPLLIAVYFNDAISDTHRWISFGSLTFQPSELAKFAIVITVAHMATMLQEKMNTFRYGILPFAAVLGVYAVLIVFETHLSATVLILAMGAIIMIVGGANLKWFGVAMVGGLAAIGVLFLIPEVMDYARDRFAYWLAPFDDPQGKGYQTIQSLYAIGSGSWMGVGIGNSRQKHLYLPEPQNDFIFSIVCEEIGFVGAALVLVLFALLVWRGFVIAMRSRSRFGALVAVGLTSQVGLQTVLNIMVVTNTIPNTGISLPFFSAGGTALLMLLCQMGVVLSISRDAVLDK